MKYDVFISYRREGGYDTAKHLNDLLVRDGYRVSFDIDTLRNGDFDTQLLSRIESCKDFILIVDKNAFARTLDPTFDSKKDWMRCELAHALKHNKNIVPIFLYGVDSFPDNLPDDIVSVVKKNGPLYDRYYFDAFYDKLKRMYLESTPNNIAKDNSSLSLLRIYPDTDCDIYLFGQKIGTATNNEFYELMLPMGENALKFVCITDKTIFSDQIIEVCEKQQVLRIILAQMLANKRKRIEYTTSDGCKLPLKTEYWNSEIIEHTYGNGKGVIVYKDDIVKISDSAFWGCRNLVSITIPNSVYSIGEKAFCDCYSLVSIAIPDSVVEIGDGAFLGCSSLSAFYGKYASLDNRCWIINGELRAFASAGLSEYTIPDSVTKIGNSALYGCKLLSIIIPNTVKSIGENAFYGCNRLSSIAIPDSVTTIKGSAFYGCDSIGEVYITNLVAWCNIDFNSGYYTGNPLSNGAKLYLNGELITNLVISDNITKIGTNTFHGCRSLTSVNINDSVKFIENNAFSYCENLASVTIGNGVTSIGSGAFYNCSKLSSVTIGSSVTSIYDSAFGSCSNLTKIDIGNSVNKLGSFVFSSCKNLTTITIPSSIISIGADIFKGCTNLACVYCKAFTPPEVAPYNSQGLGLDNNAIIYVANAAVTKYKNMQKWNEYNINEWTF